MMFDSAKAGKQVAVPVTVTTGGKVIARTGVTYKTGAHSCSNKTHTCTDLAADMVACCGDAASVSKASCSDIVE